MGCPARQPKPENCKWFGTIDACIEAGFRACKRCKPMHKAAGDDPMISMLLAALDARPDHRWTETELTGLGLDPSTVRRGFKRVFGTTFLDMARRRRLREGFGQLASGARVIDAQLAAGFDSASGFRSAFAKMLGCAPDDLYPPGSVRAMLFADWFDTDLGPMIAVADQSGLHLLEFADRPALPRELHRLRTSVKGRLGIGRTSITDQAEAEMSAFFAGETADFRTPLVFHGTAFTKSVWTALCTIPPGMTQSYTDVARQIERPDAVRAVARANGANQIAVMIPCHRVIGADGALTGYGGGLWRKEKLIALERGYAAAGEAKTA